MTFVKDPTFGYLVLCDINAKNRMGGYTGSKIKGFILNGSYFRAFYTEFTASDRGLMFGFAY